MPTAWRKVVARSPSRARRFSADVVVRWAGEATGCFAAAAVVAVERREVGVVCRCGCGKVEDRCFGVRRGDGNRSRVPWRQNLAESRTKEPKNDACSIPW